jgi:hypothetical protein
MGLRLRQPLSAQNGEGCSAFTPMPPRVRGGHRHALPRGSDLRTTLCPRPADVSVGPIPLEAFAFRVGDRMGVVLAVGLSFGLLALVRIFSMRISQACPCRCGVGECGCRRSSGSQRRTGPGASPISFSPAHLRSDVAQREVNQGGACVCGVNFSLRGLLAGHAVPP